MNAARIRKGCYKYYRASATRRIGEQPMPGGQFSTASAKLRRTSWNQGRVGWRSLHRRKCPIAEASM
jgi:hypothetical protein